MQIPGFTYHSPRSLEEALTLLRDLNGSGTIVGGGTDLLVRMKYRLVRPGHLISLMNIPGTGAWTSDERSFSLGTGISLAGIIKDLPAADELKTLRSAATLVATTQIRNMATLGGNILQNTRCGYYNRSREWQKTVKPCFKRDGDRCHAVERGKRCLAVYQGDLAPVLAVLGAQAVMVSLSGTREVPVEKLFSGDGAKPLTLDPREILTGVIIPKAPPGFFSGYRKYRIRGGMDYPLAGVALSVTFSGGRISDLRICLTGVSSAPVMVTHDTAMAGDKALSPSLIEALADRAYRSAHPIGNLEGEISRRREMVRLFVAELLREATL